MDARHRQGRAQRRQRADHGQHRPGTRTRPRRPTRRSRRFCRTLRQIRSPSRPIFPRATDRARVASHRLTPIASRDLHSQAGPPPGKTITLASLIAPRMVRPASRRKREARFRVWSADRTRKLHLWRLPARRDRAAPDEPSRRWRSTRGPRTRSTRGARRPGEEARPAGRVRTSEAFFPRERDDAWDCAVMRCSEVV